MATPTQKQASAARRAQNRARGEARPYPRVRARARLAGASYKITKRCLERRMFLSPGRKPEELVDFIGYCLAYAANKHGVQVHACVMMSNHHHTDVTDVLGELPAFKQLFHSMIARGLNAKFGRTDSFWSGDPACDTQRPSDDESLQDLVYTITNPVKSALVKWSSQWPGFTTAGWRFGEMRTFKRPTWFFDAAGEMPDEVSLTLVRPPIFRELDDDQLYAKIEVAVREQECEYRAERRRLGRRVLGLRGLARQDRNAAARSWEERFTVTPKVASSSKWLKLAQLQRNREWEREYAIARARWLAGEAVVFPAGTWWLRRFAGVLVAQRSTS